MRKIWVQRWITQTFPEISVEKIGKFSYSGSYEEEEELQAIFERTFGPMKRDRTAFQKKTYTVRRRLPVTEQGNRDRKNICWWMDTISSFPGKN